MIFLESVTKLYPGEKIPAIDNLNLHVEAGKLTVFLGKSGCGKSTTLRLINRMLDSTSGTITINGKNIKDFDEDSLRRDIGYVIQDIGLLPNKTVEENIAIVPKLKKWDKEMITQRVRDLILMIGLDPDIEGKKYPRHLSGGQMQRVGVARGLAGNPPIVLMDEPFGAVDPIARTKLQDDLLKIQNAEKKTICFVTHDIDEAIKLGDKIAIFNEGKVVQCDEPIKILMRPKNDFVKEFMGETRVLDALKIIKLKDLIEDNHKKITDENLDRKIELNDNSTLYSALANLIEKNKSIITIVDNENKPITEVSFDDISKYLYKE
ncbi:ABC transporter ATP-binding protein [Tissierella creatinophila]|uniref:ABC-type quaternary amine transporter n=1 Tax=Tissierella creatinophila DSM 6911 TaxID=1123403 RepID=A0A1U7M7T1_TISCR|nr:ABC transporter ATP-binding protein [Tissierella creatinophila]OLS03258.1 glycine betaine/carnitine/choline transport ATP-binding protein OpuCA [Tissierella creatinophila DSM 6911]